MDDEQLNRSLQSIGMACFVKYFRRFNDTGLSNAQLVDLLIRDGFLGSNLVDALCQLVKVVDYLGGRPVLGDFLDLGRQSRDARLDALEWLGVEIGHLRGGGRRDDGARDLVQAFLYE